MSNFPVKKSLKQTQLRTRADFVRALQPKWVLRCLWFEHNSSKGNLSAFVIVAVLKTLEVCVFGRPCERLPSHQSTQQHPRSAMLIPRTDQVIYIALSWILNFVLDSERGVALKPFFWWDQRRARTAKATLSISFQPFFFLVRSPLQVTYVYSFHL